MQTRKLGFTNLHLTTIGLGAFAIGGPWEFGWGPQDDAESVTRILNRGFTTWPDRAVVQSGRLSPKSRGDGEIHSRRNVSMVGVISGGRLECGASIRLAQPPL